jgi:hypothetical protein
MKLYSPVISGSLTVTGSTTFIGNITMSGSLSATASNALLLNGTGSVGFTTTGSFTTMSGSVSTRVSQIESVYATTGSNSFRATQSITGSLTVTGQIIAQTLNVQQVTSSIVFSSGSNVFGCDLNSRQTFTGSVLMTGSLIVNTTGTELQVNNNGVILGNLLTDRHGVTGSLFITGGVALRGAFDIFGPSPAMLVSSSGAGAIAELRNTVACAYLGIDNLGAYVLPTARGTAIYDGSTTRYLYVTSSGVGIGTTTPCVSLHVIGTSDSLGRVAVFNNSFNCASINIAHSGNGGTLGYASIGSGNLSNVFYVTTGAGTLGSGIVMNNAGCVGIVTNNPLYALDVRGTIAAMNAGGDGTLGTVMIYGNSGFPATQNNRVRASTSASGPANILQFETSNGTIGCYNNNQLVLRGNGNVGINTADPGSALSIAGITNGSTPVVDIRPTGAGSFLRGVRMLNSTMSVGSSLMYAVGIADNARNMGQFYFYYAGDGSTSNRLSMGLHSVDDVFNITGAGQVGIGTTSPSKPFQVNCAVANEVAQFNNTRNNGSGDYAIVTTLGSSDNNTSNYHYIAATGGADRYYLYGNGTYTTVSDCRLKKNISTVTDTYLDKINALRIVNYNWNEQEDGSALELGMIAQEVEQKIPSIVHEGRQQEDGNIYKGIQISSLPYITIKALQEQQCIICSQAAMINALKSCLGIA